MSKMNYNPSQRPPIEDTCRAIQNELMKITSTAEPSLHRVRNLVRGNKVAIVEELGSENATAMQTAFVKFKEAIETIKGVTIEDLPTE